MKKRVREKRGKYKNTRDDLSGEAFLYFLFSP
jgi:hypothetical protein